MVSSREESPDWLRSFQAPTHSTVTLSPVSQHSPNTSASSKDSIDHEESSFHESLHFLEKNEKRHLVLGENSADSPTSKISKIHSPRKRLKTEDHKPTTSKRMYSHKKKQGTDGSIEVAKGASDKHTEPCISPSRLPLVLSDKVHRSKTLVECEGESIDLSGDMGAVGRIVISDSPSENHEMYLDLKGTIYKTSIVPSRTFCVVSFGQSEAKIEAIMNDFIQLKPQSNVYEAETMVEGTLDGFSFDSDDEAEMLPKATMTDQNKGAEEQTNGKTKGKTEKTSGPAVRKKGKTAGGKARPQKKAGKKAQVSKRAKPKPKR